MFPCNFNNDCLHNVWRHEMWDKLLTVYNFKWARKFQGLYALDFQVPWNCVLQYSTWPTLFGDFMRRRNIIKDQTMNSRICFAYVKPAANALLRTSQNHLR